MLAREGLAFRGPVIIKPEHDDDSDTDEPELLLLRPPPGSADAQIIHSGHFMVSWPHSEHAPKKGYDFDTVNKQTCQTYSFGKASTCRLSIDASLTKLFECMTLAYSGKLVSPKWKNFKGLKLQWRDKIRLNNAIWRAWYMQYLEKRKNPVCHFVTPLDGSVDVDERRPEVIATEGKYWKRRIEIVIREYHKWRTYFKKRLQKHKDEDLSCLAKDDDLPFWKRTVDGRETPVPMEEDPLLDMETLMAEFSDTLFSTLSSHQPTAWPNPREIAHAGNADVIQPGLTPLQPNLDLMDTFEPFPDLFSFNRFQSSSYFSCVSSPASSSATAPSDPALHISKCSFQTSNLSSIPPVNFNGRLLTSSASEPVIARISDARRERSFSVGSLGSFVQPTEFNSGSSINSRQKLVPAFQSSLPQISTGCAFQNRSAVRTVPRNQDLTCHTSFVIPEPISFTSVDPPVITHTASVTLPHCAATTVFTQSQDLMLNSKPQVPCNISLQTPVLKQSPGLPAQSCSSFVRSKANSRTRMKPQKIVPAPQPETVPLVLKNAILRPAAFQGQTSALIVSPAPVKREVVLAPNITKSIVTIAPAGMNTASSVTEIHRSIPVATVQPAQSTVSQFYSCNMVSDVKCEQASVQTRKNELPTHESKSQNSIQSSKCSPERIRSSLSTDNNCSGKTRSDPQNVVFKNRRIKHISAEQKRRFNIKTGFSILHSFISSSTKPLSHAVILQKTVEFVTKMQQERTQLQEETKLLRKEVEELNAALSSCQQQLPATGVPITRQRFDHMRELFDEYVKSQTLQNWKFWIFSIIIKPLFESFNELVSTTSLNELYETTLSWLNQHCTLLNLRPMASNRLLKLSTTTSILSDPSRMPEQATQAVSKISRNTRGT